MSNKILVIDDDEKLQDLVGQYFKNYGLETFSHYNGFNVLEKIAETEPDFIILDIMMPGREGTEVLREIRAKQINIPVIMLTARGEDTDRILGLELGADDYLPKPFNPRELVARIKAILRRTTTKSGHYTKNTESLLEIDNIKLDTAVQEISKKNISEQLSQTEFKILKALMERKGQILSREELMDLARGKEFMALDRSIDMHISKIRAKLEAIGDSKKRIRTSWGSGYLFVLKVE